MKRRVRVVAFLEEDQLLRAEQFDPLSPHFGSRASSDSHGRAFTRAGDGHSQPIAILSQTCAHPRGLKQDLQGYVSQDSSRVSTRVSNSVPAGSDSSSQETSTHAHSEGALQAAKTLPTSILTAQLMAAHRKANEETPLRQVEAFGQGSDSAGSSQSGFSMLTRNSEEFPPKHARESDRPYDPAKSEAGVEVEDVHAAARRSLEGTALRRTSASSIDIPTKSRNRTRRMIFGF